MEPQASLHNGVSGQQQVARADWDMEQIDHPDLMFKNISTSIFAQLLTDSLIEYNKNLQDQNESEKDIAVENAWEELKSWKRQLIENYSHKIFPDSRKKDSLQNLKECLPEDIKR